MENREIQWINFYDKSPRNRTQEGWSYPIKVRLKNGSEWDGYYDDVQRICEAVYIFKPDKRCKGGINSFRVYNASQWAYKPEYDNEPVHDIYCKPTGKLQKELLNPQTSN